MNLAAINYRPTQEFIYPIARNKLALQIFAAKDDITELTLLYWFRYETDSSKICYKPLKVSLDDGIKVCYRTAIEVENIAAYIRYCFRLRKGTQTLWYGANGFNDHFLGMDKGYFEFLWPNPTDCYSAPSWSNSQIYYQIFPERFCNGDVALSPKQTVIWGSTPTRENYMGGDLIGIRQKLDYLSDLGVTCLYLTPIFAASSNHKYDTVDYYSIDCQFGTKQDLQKLVNDAHARNIRIILDGVFNHCGFNFPYFQNVVKYGADSQYAKWFFIQSYPVNSELCNYDCVGHYKWMPKLNLANVAVQNYFTEVGLYWIKECGIDGWRLDVADELPTEFIEHFSAEIRKQYPDVLILGETWGDAGRLLSGNRLDSAMNYLFKDAVTEWIAEKHISVTQFDQRINKMLSLYPQEVNLRMYNLLDSHDTARFLFACGNDEVRLRLAIALQMTIPGCPAIFYGDELGVSGDNDPLCRQAMPWHISAKESNLFNWYKQFVAFRKYYPIVQTGDYKTIYCSELNNSFVFARRNDKQALLCLLNAGQQQCVMNLQLDSLYATATEIMFANAQFGDIKLTKATESDSINIKKANFNMLEQSVPANSMKILLLEREV